MITLRDGRTLHVVDRPGPAPVVVAESGMADGHELWEPVAARLEGAARFVRYDRAGLGRSAPDPAPRTVRRLAEDLVDLLAALGEGPFVLVGHSIGGPVCRVAATRAPVAGLVLCDPTDETAPGYYSEQMAAMIAQTLAGLDGPGPDERYRARMGDRPPPRGPGVAAEYRAFTAGLAELRDEPPAPPRGPVTVLSAAGRAARPELRAAHHRYARSLPRGRVVDVDGGHDVHLEHPDLVAAEIRRLLAGLSRSAGA